MPTVEERLRYWRDCATAAESHIAELEASEKRMRDALEPSIRKAGQVAIDNLIDRGGFEYASNHDLADYLTRVVDACVSAFLATEGE